MEAVVEIPAGSRYKYEIKDNKLFLDRVLNQNVPFNYGFFPNTLCGDGDPLDVFILSKEPIPSGTTVRLSVVCGLQCEDNGSSDDKIIAVLEGEENYHDVKFSTSFIKRYLLSYKDGFKIIKELTLKEAWDTVEGSKHG